MGLTQMEWNLKYIHILLYTYLYIYPLVPIKDTIKSRTLYHYYSEHRALGILYRSSEHDVMGMSDTLTHTHKHAHTHIHTFTHTHTHQSQTHTHAHTPNTHTHTNTPPPPPPNRHTHTHYLPAPSDMYSTALHALISCTEWRLHAPTLSSPHDSHRGV